MNLLESRLQLLRVKHRKEEVGLYFARQIEVGSRTLEQHGQREFHEYEGKVLADAASRAATEREEIAAAQRVAIISTVRADTSQDLEEQ